MRSLASLRTTAGRAWPWPALLAWCAASLLSTVALRLGAPSAVAVALGASIGLAAAAVFETAWRRLVVACGFPLAWSASQLTEGLPGWAWLGGCALLVAAYPLRAWRDAPLFPTPRGALAPLRELVALPPAARVLDAGCGLGDGLLELRRAFPQARLDGVEWSTALAWLCRRRCGRGVRVHRGDLWRHDWSPYAVVYCFQRPERMAEVWAKARRELQSGAWLASLAFAVPGRRPWRTVEGRNDRERVYLYRL